MIKIFIMIAFSISIIGEFIYIRRI